MKAKLLFVFFIMSGNPLFCQKANLLIELGYHLHIYENRYAVWSSLATYSFQSPYLGFSKELNSKKKNPIIVSIAFYNNAQQYSLKSEAGIIPRISQKTIYQFNRFIINPSLKMQKKLHLHKKEINISFGLGYLFNFYGTERGLGASEFLSGTKYYPNFVDSVKYTLFTDNTRRGTVSLQMNLSYLIINKEKWNLSYLLMACQDYKPNHFNI